MRALLALEDGSIFEGVAVGGVAERGGEVVFNTAMSGYQEVLTDPSYHGQIVVFTTAHLGNYGIHTYDSESSVPCAAGAVMRNVTPSPTHADSVASLPEFLASHESFGLAGVDTRALTLKLRSSGALRGWLTTRVEDPDRAVANARAVPAMERVPAVRTVTTADSYRWKGDVEPARGAAFANVEPAVASQMPAMDAPHVVVIDYGVKRNILRELARRGCYVTVLPAHADLGDVRRCAPDGVVLSNGPGDPSSVTWALPTVRSVMREFPTLAICLGHQLIGLAHGCRIEKLRFGHHGANHPVKDVIRDFVSITSQNHNYAIAKEGLPDDLEVTHWNLNDGTVQGVRHRSRPLWSVQFHPEGAPGPHDATGVFDDFVDAVCRNRGRSMTPGGPDAVQAVKGAGDHGADGGATHA